MTYSIVARDPQTGDLGVAVQSCWFGVGSEVTWARSGIGAIASQAFGDAAYGPRGLDGLAQGLDATEALRRAQTHDDGVAMRQLGFVSADGSAAAFTGDLCIDHAGHLVGDGYAVQANMMASAAVWPAMAEAYEQTTGAFVGRLLAALHAAQEAGGDARGQMSAALKIVSGERAELPTDGVRFDLRVDHHQQPLDELDRLVRVRTAFDAMNRGTDALFAGEMGVALQQLDTALALLPDDENAHFGHAGALLYNGRTDECIAEMRALLALRPSWRTIIESFVAKGLFPLPPGVDLALLLG